MRVKLGTVLSVYLFVIFGLIGSLAAALVTMTGMIKHDAQEIALTAESIRISKELKSNLLLHNREALLEVVDRDSKRTERRVELRSRLSELLEEVPRYAETDEEKAVVTQVQAEVLDFLRTREKPNFSRDAQLDWFRRNSEKIDQAIASINKLIEINRVQAAQAMASANQQNERANEMAVGLLSAAFLIGLWILFATRMMIYRPMVRLNELISSYGAGQEGDRAERLCGLGLVETEAIADSFNAMADRLENKRQARLQFIAAVAHDIRNPISSMTMASELLLDGREREGREMVQIIRRQLKKLDRMVSDLLNSARIESGRFELKTSRIEITSLVRESIELYRIGAPLHRFEVSGTEGAIECDGDPERLTQVFNNLISNAIKYSPNGGMISLKIVSRTDAVWISISDQGIGIAPKDLAGVFKPFQRTQDTKRTIAGTGLGLSVSRRIVEAHRGTLTVESRVGIGSCFTVSLPMRPVPEAELKECKALPSV